MRQLYKTFFTQELPRSFFYSFSIFFALLAAGTVVAWTGPLSTPPNCTSGNPGCDAPLNVSLNAQAKAGGLLLNTGGAANGLIVQYGNVGIGIASPVEPLQVHIGSGLNVGFFNSTYPAVGSFNDVFNTWGNLQVNNSMYLMGATGNVGIGTTAPVSPLQVTSATDNNAIITIGHSNWPTKVYAGIGGQVTNGTSNTIGNLQFYTRNAVGDAALTQRMIIKSDGNVGIGTASPAGKLDVEGGNLCLNGSCISSWSQAAGGAAQVVYASCAGQNGGCSVSAYCPAGTYLTGGGFANAQCVAAGGVCNIGSYPNGNGWYSTNALGGNGGTFISAYAICK
jgi:hypothetical protein